MSWGIVYVANIVDTVAFTAITVVVAPRLGIVRPDVFVEIAEILTGHVWWVIFMSGLLADWMMGLLAWLLNAARDTISQVVIVWMVTSAIGFSQLHHSIVGTAEVLAGVFVSSELTYNAYGHFLLWSTLGNALGGVFFVAIIKYGHVVRREDFRQHLREGGADGHAPPAPPVLYFWLTPSATTASGARARNVNDSVKNNRTLFLS